MPTSAHHGAHGVPGTAEEDEKESEQQEAASSGTEGLSRSNRQSGTAAHAVRHHPVAHTFMLDLNYCTRHNMSSLCAGACRAKSAAACKIAV